MSIFSRLRALPPKLSLMLVIAVLLAVEFFGYLTPIKEVLNSEALTFSMGERYFSLYTLVKGLLTVLVLFWVASILVGFSENRLRSLNHLRASNKSLIIKALQIAVYFFAVLIGMDVLGIDLTTLAIFSGAVGIGIGFGLQKITSNFISGLILLFEKSVENDDLIELSDGIYGFVKETGARYTLVESFEGKEIMVPNEDFITNRVTNWTYSNKSGRIEIVAGVSYDSDIEKARDLILEAAREHPRCVVDPEPVCYLQEFGDSSVNFLLFFWVGDVTEGRYGAKSDVMRAIWKKFKENDITIPYPQRDLHIKNPEVLQ